MEVKDKVKEQVALTNGGMMGGTVLIKRSKEIIVVLLDKTEKEKVELGENMIR